ncbi:MAG: TlpA family protein disulfide reductase [Thermoanaerobaculia bacterium]
MNRRNGKLQGTTDNGGRFVRRSLRAGVLCAVAVLACAGLAGAQSNVSLPGLGGGSLTSRDLSSGTHVLVVWASWSPRCRDIVQRVNELSGKVSGARVATIDFQEEAGDVEAFLSGKGLRAPVYLDRSGDFSKAHAVTTLPGLVVYRDGELKFQGHLENDAVSQVQALLR